MESGFEVLKPEIWDIERLRPNSWNPNLQDDKTYELTKLSMIEEGFSDPIDVDPTGLILDGEHRWKAAKELGLKEVPVFVKARYEDDAKITTIRKDRTHGEPDLVRLADIVGDLVDELGSEEVERRLGYDTGEQKAFLEVTSWDWNAYDATAEDAAQDERPNTILWTTGMDPDTRTQMEGLLPLYSDEARKGPLGDTDAGRFVAFLKEARKKAGLDGSE